MTIDERIERLEHVTAAHIEQAKKDYEENRRMQRDSQASIDAIWQRMERGFEETRLQFAETRQQFAETDRHLKELGEATDQRIADLVRAIGTLINGGQRWKA